MSNATRSAQKRPRTCGSCTLCCKLLSVEEINKLPNTSCAHCNEGVGCRIYDARPTQCRTFNCYFLMHRELREEWRPTKSHIVIRVESDGQRIGAYVDPDRPGAWKREPFYSTLKNWARAAFARPGQVGQVLVSIGKQTIVILPNRDVDLGIVEDDDLVITQRTIGPKGPVLDALKIKRDDPRAIAISPSLERQRKNPAIF